MWVGALLAPESHRLLGWVIPGYALLPPDFVPPCIAKDPATEAEGTVPEFTGCQEHKGWACGVDNPYVFYLQFNTVSLSGST